MADRSAIEWTDSTWNPLRARNLATGGVGHFCEHVSEACRFCYAERNQPRFKNPIRFARQDRAKVETFLDNRVLMQPLHWRAPRMIFPCSMTDLFGEWVTDEELDQIFAVMALCPQHTFQPLTKRSARMRRYLAASRAAPVGMAALEIVLNAHAADPKSNLGAGVTLTGDIPHLKAWPLPNVWLGVSAEDQARWDERVPDLEATPAAIRFVSYEPALGPLSGIRRVEHPDGSIECWDYLKGTWQIFDGDHYRSGSVNRLDLIISGGESGRHARITPRALFRSVRDQCAGAGVAYFHKQNGEWIDADEWLVYLRSAGAVFKRIGADLERPLAPLNYQDAAALAKASGHPWEHLSDGSTMIRVGKKSAAGRLLDGVEHNALPSRALEKETA